MAPKKKQKSVDLDDQNGQPLTIVREVLENTQASIKRALDLLNEKTVDHQALIASLQNVQAASQGLSSSPSDPERIIEGVFNGEKMVGPDGVEYTVPANYASKSKLVEGDILKLTITANGSFVYKQIGPIERQQKVVALTRDDVGGDWYGIDKTKRWKLLTAAVTYFHGQPGDEVVILIPRDGGSTWAAVENIIKANG